MQNQILNLSMQRFSSWLYNVDILGRGMVCTTVDSISGEQSHIQKNFILTAFSFVQHNETPIVLSIEDVFRQIILETAIQSGQAQAHQDLIQIANEMTVNPTGPPSNSMYELGKHQASGDIRTPTKL